MKEISSTEGWWSLETSDGHFYNILGVTFKKLYMKKFLSESAFETF